MSERFSDELRWFTADGVPRDQYERTAEDCATAAAMAADAAEDIRAVVAMVTDGAIVLGRLGGARQVQRLSMSAELFDVIAERDRTFAAELRELTDPARVHAPAATPVAELNAEPSADSLSADLITESEVAR